jgi:ribosomal protein S18 acetylase RimI-like enzyme
MVERTQQRPLARRLTAQDEEAVRQFVRDLPEGDRTFIKEDFDDEAIARWCTDDHTPRWVIGEGGEVYAMLSLIPGALWSSHVGELRMVVAAAHRRRGLGRALARIGLAEALDFGLRKIIVEVAADKESDIEMFTSIGFSVEALLKDHICDRNGHLRDLVILAHDARSVSGSMGLLGFETDLSDTAAS